MIRTIARPVQPNPNLTVFGNVNMTDAEAIDFQNEQDQRQAQRIADYLPAYRYERETGGVLFNGNLLQTDRESRANWIGALIRASSDPAYTVEWKTIDGFVTFNAAQAIAAANAVASHVQKCFAAEASISGQTFPSISAIKTAFDAAYEA